MREMEGEKSLDCVQVGTNHHSFTANLNQVPSTPSYMYGVQYIP